MATQFAVLNRAFRRAIDASQLTQTQLAALCDYTAQSQLSSHLNGKVRLTQLNLRRLRMLAEVVGYEGELVARRG